MRSFDFLFPGTPNLPANIVASQPQMAATTDLIVRRFTDAADAVLSILGIPSCAAVSTSPEVVEPDSVVTTGGSVTPTLSPVPMGVA